MKKKPSPFSPLWFNFEKLRQRFDRFDPNARKWLTPPLSPSNKIKRKRIMAIDLYGSGCFSFLFSRTATELLQVVMHREELSDRLWRVFPRFDILICHLLFVGHFGKIDYSVTEITATAPPGHAPQKKWRQWKRWGVKQPAPQFGFRR